VLWKDDVPEYSVLWLREPDRAQHASAPGSEAALAAIRATDVNFGLLLRALDEKKIRDRTDILVVSDHGFSTIERLIDVAELLRDAGFNVAGDKDLVLAPGQVRIAGNGGTNLYYVGDRDAETTARLIEFLQRTDFAGVIFSRQPAEGTFPLADAQIETADGPDVVMSFRWNDGRNAAGVPGHIAANGAGGKYKATHGTLSPFDVQNMFIAAGPDFRGGTTSELPTANTDVAATILHLLGITPPEPLDGRVVAEAMTDNTPHVPSVEAKTLEATRELPGGSWQQYLRASRVGSSVYLHEGNGQFLPPP
jgi:arylsulfatase A-like enzyme